MRFRLMFVMMICLLGCASTVQAQEIGFVEDFALAIDREKALQKLIPGTEAYYYYHCLHYQNTQQFDQVDKLIEPWIKRFGRTPLVQQIQNRQALLTYANDPQAALDYLRKELNLRFDHQREIPEAQRNLPTSLDPSLISFETLSKPAFGDHRNTDGFEQGRVED